MQHVVISWYPFLTIVSHAWTSHAQSLAAFQVKLLPYLYHCGFGFVDTEMLPVPDGSHITDRAKDGFPEASSPHCGYPPCSLTCDFPTWCTRFPTWIQSFDPSCRTQAAHWSSPGYRLPPRFLRKDCASSRVTSRPFLSDANFWEATQVKLEATLVHWGTMSWLSTTDGSTTATGVASATLPAATPPPSSGTMAATTVGVSLVPLAPLVPLSFGGGSATLMETEQPMAAMDLDGFGTLETLWIYISCWLIYCSCCMQQLLKSFLIWFGCQNHLALVSGAMCIKPPPVAPLPLNWSSLLLLAAFWTRIKLDDSLHVQRLVWAWTMRRR